MAMEFDAKKILIYEYAGIIVLFILFCVFDFFPKYNQGNVIKKEIHALKEDMKKAPALDEKEQKQQFEKSVEKMRNDLDFVKKDLKNFKSKIIRDQNIFAVSQEIVNIADKLKIEPGSVKVLGTEAMDEAYETLGISVIFKSKYYDLMKFLSDIETSSLIAGVRQISLNKGSKTGSWLDINMTVYAVFEKKPGSASGQDADKRTVDME